jgi:hypothetical protein
LLLSQLAGFGCKFLFDRGLKAQNTLHFLLS